MADLLLANPKIDFPAPSCPPVTVRGGSSILHGARESPLEFATCCFPPTAMPLGIRPLNDFAFKKIFGTPENRLVLISLLNAVLQPKAPIVEVTLENPFKPQDFHDDKLSVLDIKAVDRTGVIYDVEMQLTTYEGLVQRIVYYGCQLYAGQLKAGETHKILRPVYTIWLVEWPPLAGRDPGPPCLSLGRR